MEISWLISLIFCFSIPIFIILRSFKKIEKLKLPPGPPKLPILGNIHQLVSKIAPVHHKLLELSEVYGPIMHLRVGETSTVVISSAEMAKLVIRNHDANFSNRPTFVLAKYIYYNSSDIGLAPYGEYWRQIRKIATLELLSARRVQSFRTIREEETTNMVKSLATDAAQGCLVNLKDRIFGLIFEVTCRMVFNGKLKEKKAYKALIARLKETPPGFTIADLYPSMKLLHSIDGAKKSLKEMVVESNRLLDPVIQEHISNMIQGNVEQEDLIDVLVKVHQDYPHDSAFSLTNNNIKAIILELFTAGAESTSTIIEWVMAELIKNPKAMERAQNEVRQVYNEKGPIDESRLDELKFLKMVISETLRLHPFLFPRESIEGCKINGYDIPPKTQVLVNVHAIGRDPNHWSEPNMFKPERFEESSVDFKGNHFHFLPFGSGRRMCPGMQFGIANLELPLANLLYHFDWKLPNGARHEDLNMDESFSIAVKRKVGLYVIPVSYKHSCLSQ